jgi:hypothetical protein
MKYRYLGVNFLLLCIFVAKLAIYLINPGLVLLAEGNDLLFCCIQSLKDIFG